MNIVVLDLAGGAANITCGDAPTGGATTVLAEGWFRVAAISRANRPLLAKYGVTGHEWALYVTRDGRLYWVVFDSGGVNVAYSPIGAVHYGSWLHLAGCYNGSACKVFVDGADVTLASRVHGGTVSDTAQAMRIGGYIGDVGTGFVGRVSWCRVSDTCRYPGAVEPPERPPTVDGNTVALWHVDEGSGLTLDNAEGTAAYDGVISGASWAMSVVDDKARATAVQTGWFGRTWAQGPVAGIPFR